MVMTLRKRNRVIPIQPETESESEIESETPKTKPKTKKPKINTKNKGDSSSSPSSDGSSSESDSENEVANEYENIREQRMRENKERMMRLGIMSLASQVFNAKNKSGGGTKKKPSRAPAPKRKRFSPLYPRPPREPRRSQRLVKLENGEYLESEGLLKEMGISPSAAWKPEVYTEEHVKLLGDCQTDWTLKVDGFNEDGDRLYDPYGTPCHQCRQKVLGKLTYCGKCRSSHGQFCGDCLYTRYGENVLEAIQNPSWSCPVCRDICNCSRCRRSKGWQPINIQHCKVIESGFKSVAHYLILTRCAGAQPIELNDGVAAVDMTKDNTTAQPQNEGSEASDYSAESSEFESDDSESDDETKGKNNEQSVRIPAEETGKPVVLNDGIATVDLTEEKTVPQKNEGSHYSADNSEGEDNKEHSVELQAEEKKEPVQVNDGIPTVDLTEETTAPQQNEGSHYSADDSVGEDNKEHSVELQAEENKEPVQVNDGIPTVDLTEEITAPQQNEGSHYSADDSEGEDNKEHSVELQAEENKEPVQVNDRIPTVDLTEETTSPQQNEGSHYSADDLEGKDNKEQSDGIQPEETKEPVGLNDGIATVDLTDETTVLQQGEGSHYSADDLKGNNDNMEQSNEVAVAADEDQVL